jgi:hypothetical protein
VSLQRLGDHSKKAIYGPAPGATVKTASAIRR